MGFVTLKNLPEARLPGVLSLCPEQWKMTKPGVTSWIVCPLKLPLPDSATVAIKQQPGGEWMQNYRLPLSYRPTCRPMDAGG